MKINYNENFLLKEDDIIITNSGNVYYTIRSGIALTGQDAINFIMRYYKDSTSNHVSTISIKYKNDNIYTGMRRILY